MLKSGPWLASLGCHAVSPVTALTSVGYHAGLPRSLRCQRSVITQSISQIAEFSAPTEVDNLNRAETPTLFITMRFLLVMVLSIVLIFLDVRMKLLSDFRYYIETALYPVLVFAEAPQTVSEAVSTQIKTRADLIEENERLSNENYLQRVDIMRLQTLEQENAAMRKLLNSPVQSSSRRMFAEVISVDSDPYLQRIVVNRGTSSGVYEGMPVITDEGLVGQVVSVAYASSRVLLFSDPSSAIPVVNIRNQVRSIVSGTGMHDELIIDNMPRSVDIKEGDLLVTSGLGGIYPEGYPVAIVSSVGFSDDQPFAQIKARPVVDSDKIRYVLMYFYQTSQNKDTEELQPKEQTDSKRKLRQERIRRLIDSLTDVDRTTGYRPAEKKNDSKQQLGMLYKTKRFTVEHRVHDSMNDSASGLYSGLVHMALPGHAAGQGHYFLSEGKTASVMGISPMDNSIVEVGRGR